MASESALHLLKLCVGATGVEDLRDWQAERIAEARAAGRPAVLCTTRLWPKNRAALVGGGSLYWVFKGLVLARQRILAFEPTDWGDGVERCGIVLDPALVRTEPQPRRPFQGWRYLTAAEAPPDLGAGGAAAELPPALESALAEVGVAFRRARSG